MTGIVPAISVASRRAGLLASLSWLRRSRSCSAARANHSLAPGKKPRSSRIASTGAAMAANPARGMGMEASTSSTGAPHESASALRRPPVQTATICPPRSAAMLAAESVSSVSPENDTANTSVRRST